MNKAKVRKQKKRLFGQKAAELQRFTVFRLLHRNRRAVSAVVSNLILVAAVIAIGLVVLSYARSMSINYQAEYGEVVGADITKLKESLSFEYASYSSNSHNVSLYFLNSGAVAFSVASVTVNDSPVNFNLYPMNATHSVAENTVGRGVQAYIVADLSAATLPNGSNTIEIASRSGSSFAYNFLV